MRGALQGISDWFDNAANGIYKSARDNTSDAPMPKFLARAERFPEG